MSMLEVFIDESREPYFPLGFPLSRSACERFGVPELLAQMQRSGNRSLTNAIRQFAAQLNTQYPQERPGVSPVHASTLLAAGLLGDVYRHVMLYYGLEQCRGVFEQILTQIRETHGLMTVDRPIRVFVHLFPPASILQGRMTEERFLSEWTQGWPQESRIGAEMLLLWLARENPAMASFSYLFDDTELAREAPYRELVEELRSRLREQPPVDPFGMDLVELLRSPVVHAPDSVEDQLQYVLDHWAAILPQSLLKRLLVGRDIIREESLVRGLGRGENLVPRFRGGKTEGLDDYPEPEQFTPDADWMANVVLIAKSAYVWLDQLSKKYQRSIRRLDEIPDEELDELARWGFTALWLIGVWERSVASQWIKQHMGNPEAMASAYSLYDYVVAEELGGDAAVDNLRQRAWRRGMRLASDMVPNHVGLYSRWVVEHPDWFLQASAPPYPSYQYTGPDLCPLERVTVQIEDGYWEHRDAAVVFKRTDNRSGEARYIYHGNDGTSMPWNDTAQLNYLMPEVREAVIQTILHVARQFPVIRFDAAMTLAKKHYQRLWFPKPGEGGAIPSRSEHSMTREEFDRHMPKEFWREVVERVQEEAPDTLLLAEAFWLMEGYFVRTLGMHRVYNSAFMNMLKMEENSKFRDTIKNVLEFSPQVLKRFVNFMNNPDELTAVEQFGKGDKYFGAAVMLVTLPGLPMFGHGQIQGYTEKYGMEYRRAYWDEEADMDLVRRHEAEVFPLMRKRYLFSHAEDFVLYDFWVHNGDVDENVYVYTNRAGQEKALVIYNNAYNTTSGWIRSSVRINRGSTDKPEYFTTTLGEALDASREGPYYYVFRDHRTDLEYIRHGPQLHEQGLFVQLGGYQYHVFLDFREIYDHDGAWGQLAAHVGGGGVRSIDVARIELLLAPVLEPFREAMSSYYIAEVAKAGQALGLQESLETRVLAPLEDALRQFFAEVARREHIEINSRAVMQHIRADVERLLRLRDAVEHLKERAPEVHALLRRLVSEDREAAGRNWRVLAAWVLMRNVDRVLAPTEPDGAPADWIDDWRLFNIMRDALARAHGREEQAAMDSLIIPVVLNYGARITGVTQSDDTVADPRWPQAFFEDPKVRECLAIHSHGGVLWLNKERMERLMGMALLTTVAAALEEFQPDEPAFAERAKAAYERVQKILGIVEAAEFQVGKIAEALSEASVETHDKTAMAREDERVQE